MLSRGLLLLAAILIGGLAWLLYGVILDEREPTPAARSSPGSPAAPRLSGRNADAHDAELASEKEEPQAEDTPTVAADPGWLTLAGRLEGAWVLPTTMEIERDVWVHSTNSLLVTKMSSGGRRPVDVAADGTFRTDGLVPGRYRLEIEDPYAPTVVRVVDVWHDVSDLVLERSSGCTLRGTLRFAPGYPPAPFGVTISPPPDSGSLFADLVPVSANGSFVVEGLASGPATLTVYWIEDSEDVDGFFLTFCSEQRFRLVLQLPETQWTGTLRARERLRLVVAAPPLERAVRGDLDLESAEGACTSWRVELAADGSLHRLTPDLFSANEVVDEDQTQEGALVLPPLARGAHRATLDLPGFVTEAREIRVKGPSTIRWALCRQPGRWVRVETEEKVWWLDARAESDGNAWKEILWADERVHWRWQRHPEKAYLAAGRYWLRLRSATCATAVWGPVEIEDTSKTLRIRPQVEPGLTMAGPVLAPDLRWFEGLPLYLLCQRTNGDWVLLEEKVALIEEGRYAFHGLEAGRYRIAPTRGGQPTLAEVDVRDEDVEHTLNLGPKRKGREDGDG